MSGTLQTIYQNLRSFGVAENTAAWFGAGYNAGNRSTVDRITYATDTATASVRGPLS